VPVPIYIGRLGGWRVWLACSSKSSGSVPQWVLALVWRAALRRLVVQGVNDRGAWSGYAWR